MHCIVTSPPYFGQRDYDVPPTIWRGRADCSHQWKPHSNISHGEICKICDAWRGALGLEPDLKSYIEDLTEVFDLAKDVLRDDGTLWLNLGDKRPGRGGKRNGSSDKECGRREAPSVWINGKAKDLQQVPESTSIALRKHGWILRQTIVWFKTNTMPESASDRCTTAHEYIYHFCKNDKYYFDGYPIRESASYTRKAGSGERAGTRGGLRGATYKQEFGRNARSVWPIAVNSSGGEHLATFPPKIPERCILAGTSAYGCCSKCGAPWKRILKSKQTFDGFIAEESIFSEWNKSCGCKNAKAIPCTVLDPFGGSGTTGMVSSKLNRDAIIIELNPKYADICRKRAGQTFNEIWD